MGRDLLCQGRKRFGMRESPHVLHPSVTHMKHLMGYFEKILVEILPSLIGGCILDHDDEVAELFRPSSFLAKAKLVFGCAGNEGREVV